MKNKGFITFFICSAAALWSVTFVPGCKKPSDNIGSDIGVIDGNISSAFLDTFSIKAITDRDDSVRADRTSLVPFGSFFDPYFGITTSSMYVNFGLEELHESGLFGANVDSVVLRLRYGSPTHFGNIGKYSGAIKVTVYKLIDKMEVKSTSEAGYSSIKNFNYINIPIGSATIVPNPYDSVMVNGKKEAPHIQIRLKKAFGQNLLSSDPFGFVSNDAFTNYFRGVYLKVEPTSGGLGAGGFVYLLPPGDGSRMSVYYNDSLSDEFPVDKDNSVWVGHHEHNYSSAIPIFGANDGENLLVVQPLTGTKVKIHFPYLDDFNADKSLGVNKAELVFPVYSSYTGNYPVPSQLLLARKASNDSLYNLADYIQSQGSNGGAYDADKKEYKFNITLHVQSVLAGIVPNDTLVLESAFKQTRGDRAVLYGTNNPLNRVKLRIYYTKLQ